MDDLGGPTVARRVAATRGRVNVFLQSTVVVAQERVREEPSAHVLGLLRWRLPLFSVVAPTVVGQDASRQQGRVEYQHQKPTQGETRMLGSSSAGRGRVDEQGVHDVRQWVQHAIHPGYFRRDEVSPLDAWRLGGV